VYSRIYDYTCSAQGATGVCAIYIYTLLTSSLLTSIVARAYQFSLEVPIKMLLLPLLTVLSRISYWSQCVASGDCHICSNMLLPFLLSVRFVSFYGKCLLTVKKLVLGERLLSVEISIQ